VWFAVAGGTLKARALAARPSTGVLLHDGSDAVVVRGKARLLDPMRPASLLLAPSSLLRAQLGLAALALRNPRELAGFALDMRSPGALAGGLVLAEIEPATVVTATVPTARRADGIRIPGLPARVAELPAGSPLAVLGWLSPAGPVALPASWDGAVAGVPAALAAALGVRGAAPACVTFDAADAARPTGKRGVMLRGRGVARSAGIELDVERATWWAGFATGTLPVD
jgi:hypothetical protein